MLKVVLLVLVLAWAGALPRWPWSEKWGPLPSIALFAAIFLVMVLAAAGCFG